MPELVTLGPWLRRFLCEHIVTERNLARNTRTSYRDTFSLLLPFVSRKLRKPVDRLGVRDLTSRHGAAVPRASRGGSRLFRPDPQSAACRNPSIRSLRRQPGSCPCRMVRPYPGHRIEEIHAATGRMADQGGNGGHARRARPQDQAGPQRIRAAALPLQHWSACLRGYAIEGARSADSGAATAVTILPPCTERAARRASAHCGRKPNGFWQTRFSVARSMIAVFVSRLGTPFTRFGVYRLIERCAARVPELAGRTITPHVIRHTTACHLVLAGVDINTIRAWLGHVSISTTNIYAEIDLTLKANAVALCEVGQQRPGRSWKEDKDLMAFLKSL